ncbi:hypothetical protein ACWCQZ_50015, partial [Streptomyces sp. NPDC002285]
PLLDEPDHEPRPGCPHSPSGQLRLRMEKAHCLAPVRHLQLESLLSTAPTPMGGPAPDMDELFAQVARAASGVQDIEAR